MNTRVATFVPAVAAAMGVHSETIPYFPSASDPDLQGFVRVINHSEEDRQVSIQATDDSGTIFESITLDIGADQTVHFNSADLELGNFAKGLSAGVGAGTGDWRLEIAGEANVQTLAYIRTPWDGFLTAMMDTVPRIGNRHHVPVFNPGSNVNQLSRLRLVNAKDDPAEVAVVGIDDDGTESEANLTVPAYSALTVTAAELEADGLGDGRGKWQLVLIADAPLIAMNLMSTPTGHVTNLSGSPTLRWRGLVVAEESRCPEAKYDRDEYGSSYRSKEDDIIEELGAIFDPYTGICYDSGSETTIDHMVALHQAHHSEMCFADTETKQTFGGDILNLTLAAGDVNSRKSSLDAFDWMPDMNKCWFAQRMVDVRLKYGMTVDKAEAQALELVLAGCESTEMVKPDCASED